MSRWVQLAGAADVPPGEGRTVTADGLRLALFNDGGEFFAVDDNCPHQGASLGDGVLHEGRIICPLHSWVFDVRTGQCPRNTHAPVRAYPTRCSGGSVEVELPDDPDRGTP